MFTGSVNDRPKTSGGLDWFGADFQKAVSEGLHVAFSVRIGDRLEFRFLDSDAGREG
jgi:hypothetical protein